MNSDTPCRGRDGEGAADAQVRSRKGVSLVSNWQIEIKGCADQAQFTKIQDTRYESRQLLVGFLKVDEASLLGSSIQEVGMSGWPPPWLKRPFKEKGKRRGYKRDKIITAKRQRSIFRRLFGVQNR